MLRFAESKHVHGNETGMEIFKTTGFLDILPLNRRRSREEA